MSVSTGHKLRGDLVGWFWLIDFQDYGTLGADMGKRFCF
jgi:hypothetical protein